MINFKRYDDLFSSLSKKYERSKPYKYILIDDFLEEDLCGKVYQELKNNKNILTPYKSLNVKKYAINDYNNMGEYTRKLIEDLNSKRFCESLKFLTGEKLIGDENLEGGGVHFSFKEGFLKIHTDFQSHIIKKTWERRINILLYFNKHWNEKNNGNIELWNEDLTNNFLSAIPKINRCLIFCTTAPANHGHPNPLKPPENDFRKSIALYYYKQTNETQKLVPTNFISKKDDSLQSKIFKKIDYQANYIYSYLKRKGVISDKILNKFSLKKKK